MAPIVLAGDGAEPVSVSAESGACEWVRQAPPSVDRCAYVRAHCETEALVDYMSLYYCRAYPDPLLCTLAVVCFALLLAALFRTLARMADEYFSSQLTQISQDAGLPPRLAGVTLLALGNGAPDLSASVAAIKAGQLRLALGALTGAGMFIACVVAGRIVSLAGGVSARGAQLRDATCFGLATALVLAVLASGSAGRGTVALLLAFYGAYVVAVGVADVSKRMGLSWRDSGTLALAWAWARQRLCCVPDAVAHAVARRRGLAPSASAQRLEQGLLEARAWAATGGGSREGSDSQAPPSPPRFPSAPPLAWFSPRGPPEGEGERRGGVKASPSVSSLVEMSFVVRPGTGVPVPGRGTPETSPPPAAAFEPGDRPLLPRQAYRALALADLAASRSFFAARAAGEELESLSDSGDEDAAADLSEYAGLEGAGGSEDRAGLEQGAGKEGMRALGEGGGEDGGGEFGERTSGASASSEHPLGIQTSQTSPSIPPSRASSGASAIALASISAPPKVVLPGGRGHLLPPRPLPLPGGPWAFQGPPARSSTPVLPDQLHAEAPPLCASSSPPRASSLPPHASSIAPHASPPPLRASSLASASPPPFRASSPSPLSASLAPPPFGASLAPPPFNASLASPFSPSLAPPPFGAPTPPPSLLAPLQSVLQALQRAGRPLEGFIMGVLAATTPILDPEMYDRRWFVLSSGLAPLFAAWRLGWAQSWHGAVAAGGAGAVLGGLAAAWSHPLGPRSLCGGAFCRGARKEEDSWRVAALQEVSVGAQQWENACRDPPAADPQQSTQAASPAPPELYLPNGYPLGGLIVALLGFGIAALWINALAGEIVGLLRCLGVLGGVDATLMGATVLAWGNSLMDYVTNTAMAARGGGGHSMAMTACFAGPLFNLLMGLGLGLAAALGAGEKRVVDIKLDPVVALGGACTLLACIALCAVALSCRNRLPAWFGRALVAWYALYMLGVLCLQWAGA